MIVVVADGWSSTHAQMFRFERSEPIGSWQKQTGPARIVLGKAGLAWGRGMVAPLAGPVKKEGDNKAPAGIFRLQSAFGYAAQNPGTKLPYLPLTKEIVAVDDRGSRYYNQLVDSAKVARDWKSAENMILQDDRYKWGVVVAHNIPPRPGLGSCIFLHVWKTPSTLTTGCTAMAENEMLRSVRWLDPGRRPVLVQLPRSIYRDRREVWRLPDL